MLCHFQNKPFLSRHVDMPVLSPYILGPVENACHFSFILEPPKSHVLCVTWQWGGAWGVGRSSWERLQLLVVCRAEDEAHSSAWGRARATAEGESGTGALSFPRR